MDFMEKLGGFKVILRKKPLKNELFKFTITPPKDLIVFPKIESVKDFSFQYLLEPFAYAHNVLHLTK
ncbi:MAG: hypothetical protein J7L08_04435 [Candidatus Aenigmarchaeota archaeon]|nr:hypothetical protein [Candidatus Aenigmarchaeota archaeon]